MPAHRGRLSGRVNNQPGNKVRGELEFIVKTYAIHWKSMATGTMGTGTKRFEREEAEHLAAELNEKYPDIHHEAIIPQPAPVEPGVAGAVSPPNG